MYVRSPLAARRRRSPPFNSPPSLCVCARANARRIDARSRLPPLANDHFVIASLAFKWRVVVQTAGARARTQFDGGGDKQRHKLPKCKTPRSQSNDGITNRNRAVGNLFVYSRPFASGSKRSNYTRDQRRAKRFVCRLSSSRSAKPHVAQMLRIHTCVFWLLFGLLFGPPMLVVVLKNWTQQSPFYAPPHVADSNRLVQDDVDDSGDKTWNQTTIESPSNATNSPQESPKSDLDDFSGVSGRSFRAEIALQRATFDFCFFRM